MNDTIVSIDELRTNLADLIGRVTYGKDRVVIKKYNRNAAILLSLDEYEKLVDPTKRLSPNKWQNKYSTIDKIKQSVPYQDPAVIKASVASALKAVRSQKKATE